MLTFNEAEHYIAAIKYQTKLETQVELANFFGVAQSAIAGWIKRNSVRTIKKYIELKNLDLNEIEKSVKKYKDQELGIQLSLLDYAQKKRFEDLEKEVPSSQHNFSINFQVGFYTAIDELRIVIFDAVEKFIDRDNNEDLAQLVEDFDALCNYVITPKAAKMIKAIDDSRTKNEKEMQESNARARNKMLEAKDKKLQ